MASALRRLCSVRWTESSFFASKPAPTLDRIPLREHEFEVEVMDSSNIISSQLWNREQKMSQAETIFLESFQHMLSIREPVL
jgi:hypothetical protein